MAQKIIGWVCDSCKAWREERPKEQVHRIIGTQCNGIFRTVVFTTDLTENEYSTTIIKTAGIGHLIWWAFEIAINGGTFICVDDLNEDWIIRWYKKDVLA